MYAKLGVFHGNCGVIYVNLSINCGVIHVNYVMINARLDKLMPIWSKRKPNFAIFVPFGIILCKICTI